MILDPNLMSARDRYKVTSGTVLPRPIAWVSSLDEEGRPNLAPFSFFTVASTDPLTLLFSCSRLSDGRKKDTWRNIEATEEFVVNLTNEATAEAMNITATSFASDISEFEMAGLTAEPGQRVKAPRVLEAPVSYECRLERIIDCSHYAVIFGRVECIYIADDIYDGNYVNLQAMAPIGRLSGSDYCRVREIFSMERIINPEDRT